MFEKARPDRGRWGGGGVVNTVLVEGVQSLQGEKCTYSDCKKLYVYMYVQPYVQYL
jgi:hypothetical protein